MEKIFLATEDNNGVGVAVLESVLCAFFDEEFEKEEANDAIAYPLLNRADPDYTYETFKREYLQFYNNIKDVKSNKQLHEIAKKHGYILDGEIEDAISETFEVNL